MPKRKRVLTPDEERIVRECLAAGMADYEAGKAAGVSDRRLYEARRYELRDLPRNKRGPKPGRVYAPVPEFVDLSVEEIYRRAAELRAERWTEDERQARWNKGFSGEASV